MVLGCEIWASANSITFFFNLKAFVVSRTPTTNIYILSMNFFLTKKNLSWKVILCDEFRFVMSDTFFWRNFIFVTKVNLLGQRCHKKYDFSWWNFFLVVKTNTYCDKGTFVTISHIYRDEDSTSSPKVIFIVTNTIFVMISGTSRDQILHSSQYDILWQKFSFVTKVHTFKFFFEIILRLSSKMSRNKSSLDELLLYSLYFLSLK